MRSQSPMRRRSWDEEEGAEDEEEEEDASVEQMDITAGTAIVAETLAPSLAEAPGAFTDAVPDLELLAGHADFRAVTQRVLVMVQMQQG